MKKSLLVLLLSGFSVGTLQAADLMSAYRDAVAYDAQFAGARASLDAGREKLPQGRAVLLPTIGLSANTQRNDVDYHRSATATTAATNSHASYNSNGWTVTLTQPLFRRQNWETYNQSELQVNQSEAQFAQARQDLAVRVAQAYFDVLLAQEAIATAQAQKTAIAEQLESAKRNFEVGTSTITDTHEAQSRFDLAVATEIAAQNDLTVKQQVLRMLTGKSPARLKNLKTGIVIARPQPDDMDKWVETAEAGSPAVRASQAGLEIATREIAKQRAGHYPTLDLVATRGHSAQNGGVSSSGGTSPSTRSDTNTLGLQLAIPIFSGGATSSKDREAVALREKALADLDNTRRTAALQARQAYLGMTSGLAQVKAFEAALVSSQSSLDANKLGYEVGVRVNIDVLNAQSQYYDTRQKLVKARLDTLLAQLRLKSAAGNLVDDDMEAINALLE